MTAVTAQGRPFWKMHGLGNDFVVLDIRARPATLDGEAIRALANRRTGVGCDQIMVIETPRRPDTDAFMSIYNADGSEVGACGNGTRCVAWLLMAELHREGVVIETKAGRLSATTAPGGLVSVDMGPVRLDWQSIPLASAADTASLPLTLEDLRDPVAVNVGNPHAVFFVDDAEAVDLARLGPILETHPMFPERANIEIVQRLAADRLRMRVWERGAGITQACGTGACATLVAASRRGLSGRRAEVVLDGGILAIEWLENGHVLMTGPVALAFSGHLAPTLLP